MHRYPPVLRIFSLTGTHLWVDLYAIFRTKLMHNFSSKNSKLLEACLLNTLYDSEKAPLLIFTTQIIEKSFKQIKVSERG